MDQMNFHKQKVYALIAAAIALIAMMLPWITVNFMDVRQSWNGFRSWGILSLIGIIAVGVLTITGKKSEEYTVEFKKYTMFAFAAIAVGAFLFLIRKDTSNGMITDVVRTGFGLWLCLASGLGGLAILYGLIKIPNQKNP